MTREHGLKTKEEKLKKRQGRMTPKLRTESSRELTGISSNSNVPLKSKQGKTLLTEREQAARRVEHFNEVLNQPISDDLFDFNREDVVGTIKCKSLGH